MNQQSSSQSGFQVGPAWPSRSSRTRPCPSLGGSGSLSRSSEAFVSAKGPEAPEASATASRALRRSAGLAARRSKGLPGALKPCVESRRSLGSWQYSQVSSSPLFTPLFARKLKASSSPGCGTAAAPNITKSSAGGSTSTWGSKLWFRRSRTGTSIDRPATLNLLVLTSCSAHSTAASGSAWPSASFLPASRTLRRAPASEGLCRASTASSEERSGRPWQGKPTCLK
mmetsp:Transcript_32342/g.93167  ORF Transcript_32342/g.93167 Transcript_32342/m.93167 type:complete len:227 (-) Transcript_32342:492-1172(-)